MYNLLIGGAAGQGIETMAGILEKLLKRTGYYVFTSRDFMSRVRGGHNFTLMRFGDTEMPSHSDRFDGMVAMNEETVELHRDRLNKDGFIFCDESMKITDPRAVKINITELAKELGNPKVSGSILIGALLKIFGEEPGSAREVLEEFVAGDLLDINLRALEEGYGQLEKKYPHLEGGFKDWMILSGSRAVALGAMVAGVKFYTAYPMSPSTAIMEYLASRGEDAGIVVEQAEDEIAAVNMAIGASFAGVRSMVGTSGGGFSLMVEAIGFCGIAELPLVVVDMQRPGPATGLPTRTEQSDLKFVISAAQGEFPRMVIALRNHYDAFYQVIRAFDLSERFQIPVIILGDQYLGDSSATVRPFDLNAVSIGSSPVEEEIHEDYLTYRFTADGISPRLIPGKTEHLVAVDSDEHDERGWITESSSVRIRMVDKRFKKLESLEPELQEPEFIGSESYDSLFLAWGSTYGPVKEAVELLNENGNEKYAALVFGDIYPLPQKLLKQKAPAAKRVINIEQNATGQLAGLIREKTGIECTFSILKYDGRQISGEEILEKMRKGVSE